MGEVLAPTIPRTLTSLSLYDNQIGANGAKALAKALRHHGTNLETLNLGSNRIGEDGMEMLAPSLTLLTRLKILNLFRNRIGEGSTRLCLEIIHPCDNCIRNQ